MATNDTLRLRTPQVGQDKSIVDITLVDGTELSFAITAAPVAAQKTVAAVKDTGFLILWNETGTLCIPSDQLKYFTVRGL